jgi:hypothetical protein
MEKQKDSNYNELIKMIGVWDRRLRQQQAVFWLARALLIGLTLAILITVSVQFTPWLNKDQEIIAMILSVIGSTFVMWAIVQFWPRPVIKSAQYFDYQFDLQERVSTALELASGRISTANQLANHQLEDAYSWAKAINVEEKLPLTAKVGEWVAVVWMVIMLAIFLVFGSIADATSGQNSSQRLAIAQAAEAIEETVKDIAADTDIDAVTREELLEELKSAQTTLEDEGVTAEEASATIDDLEGLLRDESSELRAQIADQEAAQESAAEALGEPGDEGQLADLLEPQGLEKSDETALEQAAAALEATDPELAQALRDMAQALRDGDMEAAQEAMERAEQLMQEAQREQQQMEQAAEQLEESAEQMEQAGNEITESAESGQQGAGVPGMGEEGQAESGTEGQTSQTGEEEGGEADALSEEEGEAGQQGNPNPNEQSDDGGVPINESSSASELSSDVTGIDTGDLENQGTADIGQEHEYEEIFAPTHPDVEAANDEIRLQPDEDDTLIRQGDLAEDAEGRSTVPYNQVFSNYADEANSALDQSYVPLGLRDVVREYFTSLAPDGE